VATALHRRRAQSPARTVSRVAEPLEERPFWKIVLMLYGGIFVLAVLLTTVCFVAAHAAA
jgi:hypothetical protein